jgi:hypothetical protein
MVSRELFTECKKVFLSCNYFKNVETDRIRNFCRTIDGFGHLAFLIPSCDLPIDLAEFVLYILWEKPNHPIIPEFVEVLKDSIPQGDARRIEFDELLEGV